MAKFAFIYFMKHLPDQIRETVPLHVKYWHDVNPPEYQGGPFADRSGGLIIFNAGNIDSAMEINK